MRALLPFILFIYILSGCSSSRLVEEYSNIKLNFHPQKILVIGLTPEEGLQRQFEYSMVKSLLDGKINAVKSVDLFGEPFKIPEESDQEWDQFEAHLVAANFDAILISKIMGKESRVTVAQSYRNLVRTFESFSDYYKENRGNNEEGHLEDYPVINTETSLYCLCPDQDNRLVWRGNIDVINASNTQKAIRDYSGRKQNPNYFWSEWFNY